MLPKTEPVQKHDSLGLLAGGVAHDFNNLLMAILGNADLALGELPADSPVHTSISEIHSVALRAADLCQQMLIYSGHGKFDIQSIELNHLTSGLAPLLESIVPLNVKLQQNLSPKALFIDADFTRIQQVLLNLITNATEAVGDEEGTITIETGAQHYSHATLNSNTTSPQSPGPYVYLKVTDTGQGMDQETLQRVFDPFFTTKFAGRGLGLSVVQGIARGHHGTVLVETAPGKGSTLSFLLPEAHSHPNTQPSSAAKQDATAWQPKGLVLLADDEPDVLRVAARMLKKIGFEVMLAHDGIEAVEIFKDNADIIGMVVLDLTMPRLGGKEAMLRIREVAPRVPVLLSSGYSEDGLLTGSPGFIQKPYTLSRFKEALRQVSAMASD